MFGFGKYAKARKYVTFQVHLESSNRPLSRKMAAGENYLQRLQDGETLDELIEERYELLRAGRQAIKGRT